MLKLKLTNVSFLRFFSENKKLKVFLPKAMMLILLSLPVFMQLSCNTTEPDELKPGRRDYTWTVDTLMPPPPNTHVPFSISNIWGSSPNDMWAIGSGASSQILLWHYDGKNWTLYPQQLGADLFGIFGFTNNDVWIGDASNSIWRFQGNNWFKFKTLSLQGFDRIEINSIWGDATNNIYAVGGADQNSGGIDYRGIMLRYDGSNWNYLNLSDIRAGFYKITQKKTTGEFIIYGTNFDSGFLNKLYVYNGSTLDEIYSGYEQPFLNQMAGEVYITLDRKIYKYNSGKIEFWKDFPGTSFLGFKGGRNEKDFFCVSIEGLLHYNGNDLQAIFTTYPKQIGLYSLAVFEKDVFVVAYEDNTSLNFIIRGKLD